MLAQMERLMAARLHFPAVEIAHDAAFPGSTATTDTRLTRIPLRLGATGQGSLPVHHRHGRRRLTRREHRALAMASEPVYAEPATVPITAALEESRAKVALVREEELKSLRRELHDEVLPSLAVVRHRVSAARVGGPTAEDHLTEAESTIDSVVLQQRTLARSLRPPGLDDQGLVGSIGHFTASMRTRVEVEIATDAVALHITVADDGMGIAIPAATSLGMGARWHPRTRRRAGRLP
jgi:signal transduction histidine kinase